MGDTGKIVLYCMLTILAISLIFVLRKIQKKHILNKELRDYNFVLKHSTQYNQLLAKIKSIEPNLDTVQPEVKLQFTCNSVLAFKKFDYNEVFDKWVKNNKQFIYDTYKAINHNNKLLKNVLYLKRNIDSAITEDDWDKVANVSNIDISTWRKIEYQAIKELIISKATDWNITVYWEYISDTSKIEYQNTKRINIKTLYEYSCQCEKHLCTPLIYDTIEE